MIKGHASGTAIDSEDTLKFSVLSGVRARIETLPLERAADAYERSGALPHGPDDSGLTCRHELYGGDVMAT